MRISRYLWCPVIGLSLGCQSLSLPAVPALSWNWKSPFEKLRAQNSDVDDPAEKEEEFGTRVETPLIGEFTQVAGLNMVLLQGVGLVVGLDGTGGDPPPSPERQAMIEEMRRRNVKNPNAILRSPNTALVVVRGYLPPLVKKGDRFDVEVRLPRGSEATSLRGGVLLETLLAEKAIVPGKVLSGHVLAKAKGPILISGDNANLESGSGTLKRGRILGGAISLKDRDMMMYLRNDYRSVRTAKLVADQIGRRFYLYNRHGIREPAAEAKTDQQIELKILPVYRDNFPRYLQVIRNIPRRETAVARRVRMQTLQDELNRPETAEKAALQLEAIGLEAAPVLKTGLKNDSLEVRFHSAAALAYLGESNGIKALTEAARTAPAFRAYAFAALSAVEDVEAVVALRSLMSEKSTETRYGAFRALSTMDENDPYLNHEKINDYFSLHILNTGGDPLVHLTNMKKGELVIFGSEQEFETPLFLRAGSRIQIQSVPGSAKITISRFAPGEEPQRAQVSTRIADVVHKVIEFGAGYPDLVEMFLQAEKQLNLPGELAIDALPQTGRTYFRPQEESSDDEVNVRKVRVGHPAQVPNLFEKTEDRSEDAASTAEAPPAVSGNSTSVPTRAASKGRASVVDIRTEAAREADAAEASKPSAGREKKRFSLRRLFFREKDDEAG